MTMPDFDTPTPPIEPPAPKKPRRKPAKRKPAKAAAAVPKRRVPKKRVKHVVRVNMNSDAIGGHGDAELTHGQLRDVWEAMRLFKKYTPVMRARLLDELKDVL